MSVIPVFVSLLVGLLGYVVFAASRARRTISELRKQGKPMPPSHWIFGHLLVIKEYVERSPADAVFNYTAMMISRTFSKDHMFYLDFWPFFELPVLVVSNPFAANQVMQLETAVKPSNVHDAFNAMTGGPNLITMPEGPWKRWRRIFAPGFSNSYMLDQTTKIIPRAQIFCDQLREHARKGSIMLLEEATFKLTIDVISLLSLGSCFDYQLKDSRFPMALRSLIESVTFGNETNPFKRWNPFRPLLVWYYGRYLNKFIYAELDHRFSERQRQVNEKDSLGKKSIVALALDNYIAELAQPDQTSMDANFKRYAAAQIRLFLVAGHDTTSSAMTYTLHLLHTHPSFLQRVRAEHDTVFGKDPSAAAAVLAEDPSLLNQLPLTLAAIKEALRMFPPAGGIRKGSPDIVLTSEDGTQYPTAGCAVWVVHEAMHRNPAYWPQADTYLPERWLVGPSDPLYPVKGAFRPFEIGPHNCMGQTLAMTEIKTILVLTLRQFDIKPAYAEWDKMHLKKGLRTMLGERTYQVGGGGGGQHPADRYPCRIDLRG